MSKKLTLLFAAFLLSFTFVMAQTYNYNGLGTDLKSLTKISEAKTRSISPENYTGEKGKGGMSTLEEGSSGKAARDLGVGWKVNPCIKIKGDTIVTIADIDGPGAIQQIWMTPTGDTRHTIIRIYWDNEKTPSVESPIGDFFCQGWGKYNQITSIPVCVNPGNAYNCYWIMPFRKKCKITIENLDTKEMTLFYQINYTLTEIEKDMAYFHAQFRRTNPLPYKEDFVIVDNIKGKGHYVGTYMTWQSNNNGWWGEGEIKFFMDGDKKFPTICGTGTEDYFNGSFAFVVKDDEGKSVYTDYTTPYAGFHVAKRDEKWTVTIQRYGMYRWHITDPVRFNKDLKITMQALGWRKGGRYLPLQDDISSVAFWYQVEPHNKFPELPDRDYLEVR